MVANPNPWSAGARRPSAPGSVANPARAATGWRISSGHDRKPEDLEQSGCLDGSAMAPGSSGAHAECDPASLGPAVGFEIDVASVLHLPGPSL